MKVLLTTAALGAVFMFGAVQSSNAMPYMHGQISPDAYYGYWNGFHGYPSRGYNSCCGCDGYPTTWLEPSFCIGSFCPF